MSVDPSKEVQTDASSSTRCLEDTPGPRRQIGGDKKAVVGHIVSAQGVKNSEIHSLV